MTCTNIVPTVIQLNCYRTAQLLLYSSTACILANKCYTPLTPLSHPSLTFSHTPLTPLSHPSHTSLKPLSHPLKPLSHPFTPLSHPSHTSLTPPHTSLTPSQTPLTPSHTPLTPLSHPLKPLSHPLTPPHTPLTPPRTPSHTPLTPPHTLSHPSHTPLKPLSHPLTPLSHPSHTPLTHPLTPLTDPSHTPLPPLTPLSHALSNPSHTLSHLSSEFISSVANKEVLFAQQCSCIVKNKHEACILALTRHRVIIYNIKHKKVIKCTEDSQLSASRLSAVPIIGSSVYRRRFSTAQRTLFLYMSKNPTSDYRRVRLSPVPRR